MENRDLGVDVVFNLIKSNKDFLGINFLSLNPTEPFNPDLIPGVILFEGEDVITKRRSSQYIGYPATREMNLIIETWAAEENPMNAALKALYQKVRSTVFVTNGVLLKGVTLREEKTIGPYSYNTPGIVGIQLVCKLGYVDSGPPPIT